VFWRDPARGLFGLYGQYVDFDTYSGINTYVGAGEAALYLGRVTLEAIAGAERGNIDVGALGSLDIDTQFFDVARVSYYPTDNLRFLVGQSYVLGVHSGWVGAEWGVGVGGGTMASLFADGAVSENNVGTVLGWLAHLFRPARQDADPASSGGRSLRSTSSGIDRSIGESWKLR
jgi:hypothetical protein